MQDDMNMLSLLADASLVVQVVMVILVLTSLVSWVMIVQRWLYYRRSRQRARQFEDIFWSGIDLSTLYKDAQKRASRGQSLGGMERIFQMGFKEFARMSLARNQAPEHLDGDSLMDSTQRAMRIAIAREQDQLERHLPFLASVASVSPYIGLFGTVWGIMNSFRGLASVQHASLAVVAPGIAEALIATATGLFAAIPAVLAYNRYSAWAENLLNLFNTYADEFSSILHRNLHRQLPKSK